MTLLIGKHQSFRLAPIQPIEETPFSLVVSAAAVMRQALMRTFYAADEAEPARIEDSNIGGVFIGCQGVQHPCARLRKPLPRSIGILGL